MLTVHNCYECRHLDYRVYYIDNDIKPHTQQICAIDNRISDNLMYFPFVCEKSCCEIKGDYYEQT